MSNDTQDCHSIALSEMQRRKEISNIFYGDHVGGLIACPLSEVQVAMKEFWRSKIEKEPLSLQQY